VPQCQAGRQLEFFEYKWRNGADLEKVIVAGRAGLAVDDIVLPIRFLVSELERSPGWCGVQRLGYIVLPTFPGIRHCRSWYESGTTPRNNSPEQFPRTIPQNNSIKQPKACEQIIDCFTIENSGVSQS
jgi:hypothetical protein